MSMKSFAGEADSIYHEKLKGTNYAISVNHRLGYLGVCKESKDSSADVFLIQGDEAGFYIDLSGDGQRLRYLDSAFGL